MDFLSFGFAIFLFIVLALYWRVIEHGQNEILLFASYLFYSFFDLKFATLLFLFSLFSYCVARQFSKTSNSRRLFACSVFVCLCPLFLYKYLPFCLGVVYAGGKNIWGIEFPVPSFIESLVIPVGLSFYSFQIIGYLSATYRGKIEAEKDFTVYLLFTSFFPQLLAGPISRASDLIPQFREERNFEYNFVVEGFRRILLGLFMKYALADSLAVYVNAVWKDVSYYSSSEVIIAIFAYSLQIYCDFAGYSHIAIGIARLFGIQLIENFKAPYLSHSMKEFWDGWHISLSEWLRDNIYIPLGGSRCSKGRYVFNILITFLVSGIWHGAGWNFILWGLLHGLGVLTNNLHRRSTSQKPICKLISMPCVFIYVSVAWVFFRSESVSVGLLILKKAIQGIAHPSLLLHASYEWNIVRVALVGIGLLIMVLYDAASKRTNVMMWLAQQKSVIRWSIYVFVFFLAAFTMPIVTNSEFIYFAF